MIETNREKSLKWWRDLSNAEQLNLANKHFPNSEFVLISTSSNRIEQIWFKEEFKNVPDFKKTFLIYFIDIDADTGDVSQMKPVAYTENENYAKLITDFFCDTDYEPSRTYKYIKL